MKVGTWSKTVFKQKINRGMMFMQKSQVKILLLKVEAEQFLI